MDAQASKRMEVWMHPDEFMSEQEDIADRQGLVVKYDQTNSKVTIHDTLTGEGGVFDLFEFVTADDPRKFFAENF